MSKKYRVWFHYNKPASIKANRNVLTVHWKGVCHPVTSISCSIPIETHNRNSQPRCILRGMAESVTFWSPPAFDEDSIDLYRHCEIA